MPEAPLLVPIEEAARLCGLSRSAFYVALDGGKVGPLPIRFGRAVRFSREELELWTRAGCPSREVWKARRREEAAAG